MTEVDVTRLREVAEAATQADWWAIQAGKGEHQGDWVVDSGGTFIVSTHFDDDRSRNDAEHIASFDPPTVLALLDRLDAAEAAHRGLVSRLGFGDNISEPMADNDTIVEWFEERGREASEWVESRAWRNDCHLAGHPDGEDCFEHDPALKLRGRISRVADAYARSAQRHAGASTLDTDVAQMLRNLLVENHPTWAALASTQRESGDE